MGTSKNDLVTVKQRLVNYLAYRKVSHRSFERECGLGNGYVNNIRKSIQPDKLQKIISHCPDLSVEWLMSGQGEMLKHGFAEWEKDVPVEELKNNDVILRLRFFIKTRGMDEPYFESKIEAPSGWVANLKKSIPIIDLTTICSYFPELNLNWLFSGMGQMLNEGYRPEELPKEDAVKPVSPYNIHHNHQVSINDLSEKIENIQSELAEMREERKTLLLIIENMSKQ